MFRNAIKVQIVTAILIAIGVVLLADQIASWINYPESGEIIRVFSVVAVTYTLSVLFEALQDGTFRQRVSFFVNLTYNIVRLITLFVVTRYYPTFLAVVIVEVSVLAVKLGLNTVAYYRSLPMLAHPESAHEDNPPWKSIRKYGALSYVNEVGVTLLSVATDMILVSSISGGIAAGYYALSSRIRDLVSRVLPEQLLASVTKPLFFSEYGSESAQKSAGFGFAILMKGTMLVSLLVGLWLALMARPVIVHLFDPRYEDAHLLVSVMALFTVSNSIRFPLGLSLQNAQRVDLMIYSKVTAFFKIGLGLWLLPIYGVVAMALITEFTVLAQNFIMYFYIANRLKQTGDPLGMGKVLFNGLVAAVIFYFIRDYFDSLIGVLVCPLVFAVIYLGINLINKSFRPEEREFINKHLPRRLWRF